VPLAAQHEQVCAFIGRLREDGVARGQSATRNRLDLDPDAVAREMRREVGARLLADLTGLGLRIDDQGRRPLRRDQEGQGVVHGPRRFARAVPGDEDATQRLGAAPTKGTTRAGRPLSMNAASASRPASGTDVSSLGWPTTQRSVWRAMRANSVVGRGDPAGRQRDRTLACGFLRRRQDRIRLELGFLELLSHQLERDVHTPSVGRYGSGTSARAVTLAESRLATASANSKR
jgi:hypothetical protein